MKMENKDIHLCQPCYATLLAEVQKVEEYTYIRIYV